MILRYLAIIAASSGLLSCEKIDQRFDQLALRCRFEKAPVGSFAQLSYQGRAAPADTKLFFKMRGDTFKQVELSPKGCFEIKKGGTYLARSASEGLAILEASDDLTAGEIIPLAAKPDDQVEIDCRENQWVKDEIPTGALINWENVTHPDAFSIRAALNSKAQSFSPSQLVVQNTPTVLPAGLPEGEYSIDYSVTNHFDDSTSTSSCPIRLRQTPPKFKTSFDQESDYELKGQFYKRFDLTDTISFTEPLNQPGTTLRYCLVPMGDYETPPKTCSEWMVYDHSSFLNFEKPGGFF